MAFYYIKAGGTATGDAGRYASLQTGSFAAKGVSGYYATTAAAFAATTPPVGGDFLLYSTAAAITSASQINLIGNAAITGLPIYYVSIDDANMDTPLKATAAQITTTAVVDIRLGTVQGQRLALHGMWLKAMGNIRANLQSTFINMEECTTECDQANTSVLWASASGVNFNLLNHTFKMGIASARPFQLSGGSRVVMRGGSITTTAVTRMFFQSGATGGSEVEVTGADLSQVSGHLMVQAGSAAGDHNINYTFRGCQLNASLTGYSDESFYGPNKRILLTNCAATSAAAEYQMHYVQDQHTATSDTTFFRDSSTGFAISGQRTSLKVVTAAHASRLSPFRFSLHSRYAKLSNVATDTLRFYLLSSDATLTNKDVAVHITYPDKTSKHIYRLKSSVIANPLAAGTALTANSDAWTGRTTETRYQIDVDTSAVPGADSSPSIEVLVCKPSLTFYIDTTPDVVA